MEVDLTLESGDVSVYVRDFGRGRPLIHLHGGWGHDIYPFDRQVELLEGQYRVLVPDRHGYGRSTRRLEPFAFDFHRRAAGETLALMDALGLEQAVLWGHSDGAVTAVWMGLEAPERCSALVLEALHFDRAKRSSTEFFETMATDPSAFPRAVTSIAAAEHGADYWEHLLRSEGMVWRQIQETPYPWPDLFDGRMGELTAPVLVLHGAEDPRTEPRELEAVQQALPGAEICLLEGGGHSPHSQEEVWKGATQTALDFLRRQGLG